MQKRVKAAEDSTPPNAMPRMARPDDRIPDDDAPRQSTDGLPVRLAVAIPEKDEIPQQHVPIAFRRRYLEPAGAVFRIRVGWTVCTHADLAGELGEDTLDLVLEPHKGLLSGS